MKVSSIIVGFSGVSDGGAAFGGTPGAALRRAGGHALARRGFPQRAVTARFFRVKVGFLCNVMRRRWRGLEDRGRDEGLNLAPPSKPDRPVSGIRLSSQWVLV
jgi:hypothetical protein